MQFVPSVQKLSIALASLALLETALFVHVLYCLNFVNFKYSIFTASCSNNHGNCDRRVHCTENLETLTVSCSECPNGTKAVGNSKCDGMFFIKTAYT